MRSTNRGFLVVSVIVRFVDKPLFSYALLIAFVYAILILFSGIAQTNQTREGVGRGCVITQMSCFLLSL